MAGHELKRYPCRRPRREGIASPFRFRGEWADGAGAFPSGNGAGGGDFRFLVNVAPGDADRDGSVSPTDYGLVRSAVGRSTAAVGTSPRQYTVFKDVNGSGSVSPTDLGVVRDNTGANVGMVPQPPTPSATRSTAEELFGTTPML